MPEETATRKKPESKLPEFPIVSSVSPNSVEEIGAIVEREELETRVENHIENRIKELTDALDTAMMRYYHSQRPDLNENIGLHYQQKKVIAREKTLEVCVGGENNIHLRAKMTKKGLRTQFRIEGDDFKRRVDGKQWYEGPLENVYNFAGLFGALSGGAASFGIINAISHYFSNNIVQGSVNLGIFITATFATGYLSRRAVRIFDKDLSRRPRACNKWHDIDDLPRILAHDVAMQAEVLEELKQAPDYLKKADEQREKRETYDRERKEEALKKALNI